MGKNEQKKSSDDDSNLVTHGADKINKTCSHITNSYINEIENKLSKFDIKIAKEYRKFDKESKVD